MGLFDMIKRLHPDSVLIGFLNGPHGIYTNNFMEITKEYMSLFRNTGGFDMIRKSTLSRFSPRLFILASYKGDVNLVWILLIHYS